jgi:hypothetical protein
MVNDDQQEVNLMFVVATGACLPKHNTRLIFVKMQNSGQTSLVITVHLGTSLRCVHQVPKLPPGIAPYRLHHIRW